MHKHSSGSIRLATGESMAVDMCPCGTFQIHLGALSLRLHPDAVSGLLQVLGMAVARRQGLLAGRESAAGSANEGLTAWSELTGKVRPGKA